MARFEQGLSRVYGSVAPECIVTCTPNGYGHLSNVPYLAESGYTNAPGQCRASTLHERAPWEGFRRRGDAWLMIRREAER